MKPLRPAFRLGAPAARPRRMAHIFAMAVLGASCLAVAGQPFELVTAEEYQQEKDARSLITRGSTTGPTEPESARAADGPKIEVVTPDARNSVHAPVDIDVRFAPGPGARIVLGSLRIRYGMIGLDVTDRIRKAATVTEQGIKASGAALPAGSHSMSVEIADSAGRKSKQAFKFRVEA